MKRIGPKSCRAINLQQQCAHAGFSLCVVWDVIGWSCSKRFQAVIAIPIKVDDLRVALYQINRRQKPVSL